MLALSKFKNRKDLSEVEVAAVGNGNPIENNFRPAVAISNRAEYFKLVGVPQACFASRATQFRNSAAQLRHQVKTLVLSKLRVKNRGQAFSEVEVSTVLQLR